MESQCKICSHDKKLCSCKAIISPAKIKDRKAGFFDVPFNKDGMIEWGGYPQSYWGKNDSTLYFKKNDPFEATMRFQTFAKGRSSIRMNLKSDADGLVYGLFYSYFDDVLKEMDKGVIHGWWQIAKQGQNFGLIYLWK